MRLILLAILFTAELAAGDPARDARWQEDLNYLATQLPARHPGFNVLVPRARFNPAVATLSNDIPNLSDTEVMVGLAGLVAMANDGHTGLSLSQRNSTFHFLPLRMQWFSDGLFVTGAGAEYTRALGARVIQVGDRSTEDAYAAIASIISHENDIYARFFSSNYFSNADVLEALKISPSREKCCTAEMDSSTPGLWQINVRAPGGVQGQVPVFLTIGQMPSNGVTVQVDR